MHPSLENRRHKADLCVVGGGMAGLVAAVAAARRGASVVLVHDRPVLGGNASSEVRMWICGAHGPHKKETGVLEEIQLANRLLNPTGLYHGWDAVLFQYASMTPGLTTLLNCSCNNGRVEDGHLVSIDCWQLTTQIWHTIEARFFIDCSGDSILAPLSGAETRHGREAREEFDESLAPLKADLKTMGNTLLLQLEETALPQSFRAPRWAHHFSDASTLPSRVGEGMGTNFWWIELGGLQNTIGDAELIRDELMRTTWGVWDYMKNRGPQQEKLRNWRLRWMGALPGKRENRRYIGAHVLTQNDVEASGPFDDIVAYGGWSMDDHHPAGLLYPGQATLFHRAPSPYGIPLRSLYSRNVPNLFCAGRNISATHSALSSTRVMATCALLGQAVGTAAALCAQESCLPSTLGEKGLRTLQNWLMEDDCWLPGLAKPIDPLTQEARFQSTEAANTSALLDGHDRPIDKDAHSLDTVPGGSVTMSWDNPRCPGSLRLVFDSDLNDHKRMPCRYELGGAPLAMPKALVKSFRVDLRTSSGDWETLHTEYENARRLVVLPVNKPITALRFTGDAAWGDAPIRLFSMEATSAVLPATIDPPEGRDWMDIVASLKPEDIAAPDHGLEQKGSGHYSA